MTALLTRLDAQLVTAMRARQGLKVQALRTLKAELKAARDESDARRRLARYRSRCVALLEQYAGYGGAGETVVDRLVLDVGTCDGLLAPLSREATEALVRELAGKPRQGGTEALIGAVMRAAPGQLDGRAVRALAESLTRQ